MSLGAKGLSQNLTFFATGAPRGAFFLVNEKVFSIYDLRVPEAVKPSARSARRSEGFSGAAVKICGESHSKFWAPQEFKQAKPAR